MAQITKPQVTAKTYRHIAIITVTFATVVALLAGNGEGAMPGNGENRANASSTSSISTPRPASTPAYGEANFSTRGGDSASFGEEAAPGGGFGKGQRVRGRSGFISFSNVPPANSENAQLTPAYLDTLTDEELDAMLQALRDGGITSPAEMQRVTAIIEAGSRRRSGHMQHVN
ncbi:hypothetical protein [Alteraurantiacibacter palmitatis]|uniref:Secreted protein n=1 Tax=Alteraurantiacibacter palmitatis TaxID=2054628 RepID=A0ABV7E8A7_9SPHN